MIKYVMASLLSLLLSAPAVSSTAAAKEHDLVDPRLLLNRQVYIEKRDRSGEINGLFVDPSTGLVAFSLVKFTALGGLIEKDIVLPLPWHKLSLDPRKLVFTHRGPDREVDPVDFKPKRHARLNSDEVQNLYDSYASANLVEKKRQTMDRRIPGNGTQLMRYEKMLNLPVRNEKGERIGHMEAFYGCMDEGLLLLASISPGIDSSDEYLVPYQLLLYSQPQREFILWSDVWQKARRQKSDPGDYVSRKRLEEVLRNHKLE